MVHGMNYSTNYKQGENRETSSGQVWKGLVSVCSEARIRLESIFKWRSGEGVTVENLLANKLHFSGEIHYGRSVCVYPLR